MSTRVCVWQQTGVKKHPLHVDHFSRLKARLISPRRADRHNGQSSGSPPPPSLSAHVRQIVLCLKDEAPSTCGARLLTCEPAVIEAPSRFDRSSTAWNLTGRRSQNVFNELNQPEPGLTGYTIRVSANQLHLVQMGSFPVPVFP